MRRDIRLALALVILLAVFHIPAFVTPFAHTGVFWLAYAATLVAFGMAALAAFRAFRAVKGLENTIMRWRVYRTGCAILVIQVVAFFVLAALSRACPVWLAIVIEALILLFSALSLLTRDTTSEVVVVSEARVNDRIESMRRLRADADVLLKNNGDPALKAPLMRLSEALRFADPMGSEATAEVEMRIRAAMAEITDAESVNAIIGMINERQALCRTGKNARP